MAYDFEAANDAALFFGLGDWYFLSSEEKERLHADKMEMESYGKQSRDARQRNLARASARKARIARNNNKGK